MKKATALIPTLALVMGLMVGCGAKTNPTSQVRDAAQTAMQKADKTAEKVKNGAERTSDQMMNKKDTSKFIGEEKAKEAALKKAGISADGVTFDKVELNEDDGVWRYEVEFRTNTAEYEADVKAETGEILEWEVDDRQ